MLKINMLICFCFFLETRYPSSIQRLYQWTPDECIPEFFSDPTIFTSIHSDMGNLSYPDWASSPQEFIKKHKEALESENVSKVILKILFFFSLHFHSIQKTTTRISIIGLT